MFVAPPLENLRLVEEKNVYSPFFHISDKYPPPNWLIAEKDEILSQGLMIGGLFKQNSCSKHKQNVGNTLVISSDQDVDSKSVETLLFLLKFHSIKPP